MSADEPTFVTPASPLVSDADVATWAAADRQELFNEVAAAMNLNPTVIEKDYWVSFTLRHVFTGPMRDVLVFKGGTSLSKVYGLIRRFSEDIDLCVNRTALGLPTTLVGDAKRSKTQQRMVASQVQDACMRWVNDQMLPALRSAFSDSLGLTGWRCATDTSAPHELAFEYPVADAATPSATSYLAPRILLQFGARSVGTPSDWHEIRSLCASQRPDIFLSTGIRVNTLAAERTFWEKVLFAHAEYHRPDGRKPSNDRYARHYSDLVMLARQGISANACAQPELLADVRDNTALFYGYTWGNYESAVRGSLRIVPPDARIAAVGADYAAMAEMFFDADPVSFDQVLGELRELEAFVNSSQ